MFDMQHGPMTLQDIMSGVTICAQHGLECAVRVEANEDYLVQRLLDAGVNDIIVPLIKNEADTEKFVSNFFYPPQGMRSMGQHLAKILPEKSKKPIIMVETREAYEELDRILEVPDLHGVFIGPYDFSFAMFGKNGPDWQDPDFITYMEEINTKSQGQGKETFIVVDQDSLKQAEEIGFDHLILLGDARWLKAKGSELLSM